MWIGSLRYDSFSDCERDQENQKWNGICGHTNVPKSEMYHVIDHCTNECIIFLADLLMPSNVEKVHRVRFHRISKAAEFLVLLSNKSCNGAAVI